MRTATAITNVCDDISRDGGRGSRDSRAGLERGIRALGIGYTVGIAATYQFTDGVGRRWEAHKLINKVRPEQWMCGQTGHSSRGTREYD
ncbi:hypothetical protein AB0J81_08245 [Streptomyces bobili]